MPVMQQALAGDWEMLVTAHVLKSPSGVAPWHYTVVDELLLQVPRIQRVVGVCLVRQGTEQQQEQTNKRGYVPKCIHGGVE